MGEVYTATKKYFKMPRANEGLIPNVPKVYKDYKIIDFFGEFTHDCSAPQNPYQISWANNRAPAFIHRFEVDALLLWIQLTNVIEYKEVGGASASGKPLVCLNTNQLVLGVAGDTPDITIANLENGFEYFQLDVTGTGTPAFNTCREIFMGGLYIPMKEMDCLLPQMQGHMRLGCGDDSRLLLTNHCIVGFVEK
ncbi:hypothetical protein ES703_125723 [subsurface metagenome]